MMERMINVWDTAVCHGSVENLTIIYSATERRCVTHDAAARFSRFVSRVAASRCLNRKSCTQMLETARDSTLECSCNDSSCLLQQFAASRNGSDTAWNFVFFGNSQSLAKSRSNNGYVSLQIESEGLASLHQLERLVLAHGPRILSWTLKHIIMTLSPSRQTSHHHPVFRINLLKISYH